MKKVRIGFVTGGRSGPGGFKHHPEVTCQRTDRTFTDIESLSEFLESIGQKLVIKPHNKVRGLNRMYIDIDESELEMYDMYSKLML